MENGLGNKTTGIIPAGQLTVVSLASLGRSCRFLITCTSFPAEESTKILGGKHPTLPPSSNSTQPQPASDQVIIGEYYFPSFIAAASKSDCKIH